MIAEANSTMNAAAGAVATEPPEETQAAEHTKSASRTSEMKDQDSDGSVETDNETGRQGAEAQDRTEQDAVKKADFLPLSPNPSGGKKAKLDILYDVNLPVSVELGRTSMTIGEMLSVCQGSVIPLERATGEPVDILVSGKIIGKGEVVVVEDKFGVRITELVNRTDGMHKP